jgi:hypothetical protein
MILKAAVERDLKEARILNANVESSALKSQPSDILLGRLPGHSGKYPLEMTGRPSRDSA